MDKQFPERTRNDESIPNEPPPSYHESTASARQDFAETQFTTVNIGDGFEPLLANQEQIFFHSTQKIGCNIGALIVQLQDSQSRIVMSTVMTAGTTHGSGDESRTQHIVSFTDPSGKILLTCKEVNRAVTVATTDRMLGLVSGARAFLFPTNLQVHNVVGQTLFHTMREGAKFNFVNNQGAVIASAGEVQQGQENIFALSFSSPLDAYNKAMMIVTAYYLYFLYFAETPCGCRGAAALCKILFLVPILIFIIGVVVMVTVFNSV